MRGFTGHVPNVVRGDNGTTGAGTALSCTPAESRIHKHVHRANTHRSLEACALMVCGCQGGQPPLTLTWQQVLTPSKVARACRMCVGGGVEKQQRESVPQRRQHSHQCVYTARNRTRSNLLPHKRHLTHSFIKHPPAIRPYALSPALLGRHLSHPSKQRAPTRQVHTHSQLLN